MSPEQDRARTGPSATIRIGAALAALLAMPGVAQATAITSYGCSVQVNNSMRFICAATTNGAVTNLQYGVRKVGDTLYRWTPVQDLSGAGTAYFQLYNFKPGESYEWKVRGDAVTPHTGNLTGPYLPQELDELNLDVTSASTYYSKYVLFDVTGCGGSHYMIALNVEDDAHPYIAWYQDVYAEEGVTGPIHWRYSTDGTILAIIGGKYFFEWAWDGSTLHSDDFSADCSQALGDLGPCPSHDAYRFGNGDTYIITSNISSTDKTGTDWSACSSAGRFVNDGAQSYNSSFTPGTRYTLMDDMFYDPTIDGGPNAPTTCNDTNGVYYTGIPDFDWTHANSVWGTLAAGHDVLTLSLREWDEVVRYNTYTNSVVWTLSGRSGRGDYTLSLDAGVDSGEDASFGGQHDVTESGGYLQMFDNGANAIGHASRALRLELSGSDAVIVKDWRLRDDASPPNDLNCATEGSAQTVPLSSNANVLADCHIEDSVQTNASLIEELDESDGTKSAAPPLLIRINQSDECDNTHYSSPVSIHGFYRAVPLAALGDL